MEAAPSAGDLTRRGFLVAGGAALLTACTSTGSGSSAATSVSTTIVVPTVTSDPPTVTIDDAATTTDDATSTSTSPAATVLRILMPPNSITNTALERAANELGRVFVVEVYDDPAFVLDRLRAQQGEYQYDVIVVAGAFLPAAIADGRLLPLDHGLLGNLASQLESVRDSPFDPGSVYSVCKAVGYTGCAWDRTVLPEGVASWEQFLAAAATPEVSGRVTALRDGAELLAISSWAQGVATPETIDVVAAEADLRTRLVPHLLDLDSRPTVRMHEGEVVLAQMWSGEGRRLVLSDPERWGYAIGGPVTGVWMERFVVPAESTDPAGAHAFMNLMLEPEISRTQIDERGLNSGLATVQSDIASLPAAELIPTGDAMFDASKDSGVAFTKYSAEELDAIVVGVVRDVLGAVVPVPAAPVTSAAPAVPPASEPPATALAQYDDQGRRVLRPEDTGAEVEALQRRLVELGYSIGGVDGQYGDVTLAAVMSFQRSQGLRPDGVVGRYTWNALESPKPIDSFETSTRGGPSNAPSDAATHAPDAGDGRGRTWTKAIVFLDSFRDEFYDSNGTLVGSFPNSPGVNGLTPTGTFNVYSRSADTYYAKNPAETMKWMVRFNGGVGFHGIPRLDGVPEPTPLGSAPSSHGCIRHADDVAKSIYDNLADGATVIVQHG